MSYQRGSANASHKDEGGAYVPDDRKALMWLLCCHCSRRTQDVC